MPVHHTNEIAQSEAASDKPLANYWLHGEFLIFGGDKMAKSTGEFLTLEKINSFLIICFVLSDIRMFCGTYAASTKAPGLELKPFGVLS